MIAIIPAIDIIGGRCVRLSKGDYNSCRTYDASPLEMAKRYERYGIRRIHVVDLDGAKASSPANLDTLEKIACSTSLDIEWGGGIKSLEALRSVLDAGAGHVIVGSTAAKKPDIFARWLEEFGGERLILGADVRNGKVAVNGWLQEMELGVEDLMEKFVPKGLKEVICTDITKDGMLQGPAFSLYTGLQEKYEGVDVILSGGIAGMEDIVKADALGIRKAIVGKAIYEGKITLEEISLWLQRG